MKLLTDKRFEQLMSWSYYAGRQSMENVLKDAFVKQGGTLYTEEISTDKDVNISGNAYFMRSATAGSFTIGKDMTFMSQPDTAEELLRNNRGG